MDQLIMEDNKQSRRQIKAFEPWDLIIGHEFIVGALCYYQSGSQLFSDNKEDGSLCDTIMQKPNFLNHIKLYQFKEFRHYLPRIWDNPATKDRNPWWACTSAVKQFSDV